MADLIQRVKCRVGLHRPLHVVHRFGAAALVACASCEREFGIHDGEQTWVSWDGDLEQLYTEIGYDLAASRAEWRRHKRPYPVNQIGSYAHDLAEKATAR